MWLCYYISILVGKLKFYIYSLTSYIQALEISGN